MVLGGYQIPKGTFVCRHGVFSANNPKYFHEPDKFMPERWIRGRLKQQYIFTYNLLLLSLSRPSAAARQAISLPLKSMPPH